MVGIGEGRVLVFSWMSGCLLHQVSLAFFGVRDWEWDTLRVYIGCAWLVKKVGVFE
jgi:hypothetical protein